MGVMDEVGEDLGLGTNFGKVAILRKGRDILQLYHFYYLFSFHRFSLPSLIVPSFFRV